MKNVDTGSAYNVLVKSLSQIEKFPEKLQDSIFLGISQGIRGLKGVDEEKKKAYDILIASLPELKKLSENAQESVFFGLFLDDFEQLQKNEDLVKKLLSLDLSHIAELPEKLRKKIIFQL